MADEKTKVDVPFSDTWSHPAATFEQFWTHLLAEPPAAPRTTPAFRPPEQAGPAPPVGPDIARRDKLAQNLKALGR